MIRPSITDAPFIEPDFSPFETGVDIATKAPSLAPHIWTA
jgi:hypothetical protein